MDIILGYKASYILLRPHMLAREAYLRLKWAWQRVFRGWDDRVIWSIDHHLCEMLPVWLRELKKNKRGVPVSFHENGWEQAWDCVLDEMILGFGAGEKIIRSELPIYKEMDEACPSCGFKEFSDRVDEFGGIKQIEKEYAELYDIFNEGFEKFREYFFNLWD